MEIFEKEDKKIILADVLDGLESIPDSSVDLIFADPPYNIGKKFGGKKYKKAEEEYLNWCYEWLDICINKLTDTGCMYVMTSTQYMPFFDIYLRNKVSVLNRIVWHYDSSGVQAKKYYGSMYEPILFFSKNQKEYTFNSKDIEVEAKTGAKRKLIDYRKTPPQPYNTKKVPGNVWYYPRVRYRMQEYENHPTQKPVNLLERVIKASSKPGDVVMDPFSGTFTTSFVADKLDRRSIGIEAEEEYIKIGLRRLGIKKSYKGKKLEAVKKSYQK